MAYKSDLAHKVHYIYRAYIGDYLAHNSGATRKEIIYVQR